MTEWGVFLVIVALVGFSASIIAPVLKLNTSIVTLTVTMQGFEKQLDESILKNDARHKKIWKELDGHEECINQHEVRIGILEEKKWK